MAKNRGGMDTMRPSKKIKTSTAAMSAPPKRLNAFFQGNIRMGSAHNSVHGSKHG